MLDWLLLVAGGLLGSGHCVGMCGSFVLTLGTTETSFAANVRRQLVYCSGRVLMYATAGALAGLLGWRLTASFRTMLNVQTILSIVAGILLILQGLHGLGLFRLFSIRPGSSRCTLAASFGAILLAPGWREVFVAGLLNGLIPCGLVYAYLVLASASGGPFTGMLTMLLFGLGTVPAMVLTGLGGTCLSLATRHRIVQAAALCLMLSGIISIARGLRSDECHVHATSQSFDKRDCGCAGRLQARSDREKVNGAAVC